ncbi:MAG: GNAT family N-acetyltransferase [Dorea sp.]|nr:GNAT family N-acetyltransferase [Dorea sp.]MDE6936840.1 GNAT family N-acetyltransferase [Lachnospiraceae bacterium]MDE7036833.1 GNAT family N-acetyltransferase [Lachnospiraceae bacterium]
MAIQFDNHDERIRYYELMLRRDLKDLPHFPLPDGYRYVFFRPGDRDQWIDIEKSAKEFADYEQGLEAWNRYYEGKEEELAKRMVFIEDRDGRKIATATAFYDIRGIDQSGDGWLHWVAVRREYQGRGLSKPLISHVLKLMCSLGYTYAKIPTQTTTWVACKVYLDLGFCPIPKNAVNSRDGWRIIKALTNHETLAQFDPALADEISDVLEGGD